MAKNELLPFADGEDANVLPTAQWEALTDILENGFQSGIAKSEQVNRVLAQGAVASYVLGQLVVDQLSKDATLDKDTLYQNLVSALQENAKDVCLPLSGGTLTGRVNTSQGIYFQDANGYYTTFQKVVNNGFFIENRTPNGELRSRIVFRDDTHTTKGRVEIDATNGTQKATLYLLPDGGISFGGKNLVRSVNGTNADSAGNVTITIGAGANAKAYVTTTWVSGNNWYRKWSDGWIEQGGTVSPTFSNGTASVTLHTAFSGTAYFFDWNSNVDEYDNYYGHSVTAKTTTKATIQDFSLRNGANSITWYACGK